MRIARIQSNQNDDIGGIDEPDNDTDDLRNHSRDDSSGVVLGGWNENTAWQEELLCDICSTDWRKIVKGYKGMNKDMTCRGMQFEIGKTYSVDGDIELCCQI